MKLSTFLLVCIVLWPAAGRLAAQNLQLHYDLRHTVDPAQNPKNYPTLYVEYFKTLDSGVHLFKPGSFLLKTQADFQGKGGNIGKFFIQVSQSFRCWRPKVFVSLQYSGGLGVTEPKQYSFYIYNTFSVGAEIPFHWKGAWLSSLLYYKYVSYTNPSHDFLYTLYWFAGLRHYRWEIAGDFSCWTENKDHGDDATRGLSGKRFFFYAEPQLWFNLHKPWGLGTKINIYYHINTPANTFQAYPSLAIRCKL
jgi:hypothetical protein